MTAPKKVSWPGPTLPELCHALMERAPVPMAELEGEEHIVRYVNPAFCHLVGKEREALTGRPFREIAQEGDQCVTVLDRVYRTEESAAHTESEQVESHPVYWSYAMWPVLDAGQRSVGVMMQVTETTLFHQQARAMNQHLLRSSVRQHELTEAAEQLNDRLRAEIDERDRAQVAISKLAAIVESSDDAIISKDLTGVITSWNAGAERLFGYTSQEAIGQPIMMLIPPERLDEEPDILERIRRGESIEHYETVRRRKDGTLLDISLTVSPIVDRQHRIVGASKIARDITEHKRTEARLKQFTDELERRVYERTQELAQSEDHLRALATELNLAEQRERKRLSIELHDYLAQLLVLCYLTLGQAKRAGLQPRAEQLVKETEDNLSKALTYCRTLMSELSPPVLQEQGLPAGLIWLGDHMKQHELAITVEIQEAFDVPLPEDRAVLLFQSVRELLINVAKHGVVKKAAVRMTYRDGLLQIVVSDENGFDLAASASATGNTSPLSSKFGLFSIRERMKALGGSFDLQSVPGEGTIATLTLPVALRREPVKQTIHHQPSSTNSPSARHILKKNAKIRVLLVDDQTLMREGLRSIVSAYNHLEVVGEASDGVEAVELSRQLDPDIVVMDINMPNMDGIEATRQIKLYRPDITVVGLSVNPSAVTEQKMKTAGAAAYLTKESAADALYQAIREAVEGSSAR